MLKNSELFNEIKDDNLKQLFAKYTYPWEVLPNIKAFILELIKQGLPGYSKYKDKDDVLVGNNVTIANTATINGPAIICDNVEIRPGAYIRGSVYVGADSVVGNSSELKNCILIYHAQVPHYNYVGDSILGSYSHMGAGSICSNLKNDGSNIVIHANEEIPTGIRKIGGILGDHVDVGCGSVLNPGTIIGAGSATYPLSFLRGVYPSKSIIKNTGDIVDRK